MTDRRQRLANQIAAFMRQYERKAHKGHDPNDRSYSRKTEKLVKRMDPVELDAYLREDGQEDAED